MKLKFWLEELFLPAVFVSLLLAVLISNTMLCWIILTQGLNQ